MRPPPSPPCPDTVDLLHCSATVGSLGKARHPTFYLPLMICPIQGRSGRYTLLNQRTKPRIMSIVGDPDTCNFNQRQYNLVADFSMKHKIAIMQCYYLQNVAYICESPIYWLKHIFSGIDRFLNLSSRPAISTAVERAPVKCNYPLSSMAGCGEQISGGSV